MKKDEEPVDEDARAEDGAAAGEDSAEVEAGGGDADAEAPASDAEGADVREVPPEETVEHWHELYLRAKADLQNVRRRMMQETEDQVQRRMEALLHDLIRVSDYLEAALGNVPESVRAAEHSEAFLAGMDAIRHALDAVMQGHGMEFLAPETHHEFDPDEHEAVEKEVLEDLESPRLELIGRGYRIGRRILRPARVRLLSPPPAGADARADGDDDDDGRG